MTVHRDCTQYPVAQLAEVQKQRLLRPVWTGLCLFAQACPNTRLTLDQEVPSSNLGGAAAFLAQFRRFVVEVGLFF